ncbi:uncharacterized protein LOC124910219 isoform X2 [Impatiens glandulifera]|uniref:uncharacterized protein LOC124910219 isoform X2 n=1 Tax=Impatiens glandulifera TaxID=253017 RepID=UPI001FB0BC3C|nr:uncharacterized protein LOC124910219 isoform X2 [Impatiens glandulifera]
MAAELLFTEGEMVLQKGLGYPKAFAKLCKDHSFNPYFHGPPFTFIPYPLQQIEEKEFEEMFPIIDPNAKPTMKPKIFVNLIWKNLNHLGNAGFDPDKFRVDPYGNVLYYHADPASPLAWEIDHWFPCSRGGMTVASNLRILQWQICKKKKNTLEFLIPWWDLQVGISITQFLSIFASSNSDFRNRAFSWLFMEGANQELNVSQTVESHLFPQHFDESKEKIGLAPAAVVLTRGEFNDTSVNSLDFNRRPRSNSPIMGARILRSNSLKEKENENPYKAIVMARDSLRHKEAAENMQVEIQKLDNDMNELKQIAEEEKIAIQELELVLIKRRRRAEKCRRVAEAQSSHRIMIEKMIRDSMHQSVIYKEQMRLNQAASNSLMARLEAQRAICDSSEKELLRKFKQRDELEKQIMHDHHLISEQTRKRSRLISDNDSSSLIEGNDHNPVLYLHGDSSKTLLQNEESNKAIVEDEEMRNQRGKDCNQLQKDGIQGEEEEECSYPDNIQNPIQVNADSNHHQQQQQQQQQQKFDIQGEEDEIVEIELNKIPLKRDYKEKTGRLSFDDGNKDGINRKEKKKLFGRSESARVFRRVPSSPSIMESMRKGVDFIRKKTIAIDDNNVKEDDENHVAAKRNFIKSSIRTIKKAVKF